MWIDAVDSQTVALVSIILDTAVIQTAYIPIWHKQSRSGIKTGTVH